MRESSIRSRKAGERNISANSVRKVTEVCGLWTRLLATGLDTSVYGMTADCWPGQRTLRKFKG
jgi:hypothetical protein